MCVCVCVYTHISYRVEIVYELPLMHIFTQIGSGAKLTGYLSLGAGLAVIERVRDVGQNVLQSSFQTESISSHNCLGIFFHHISR
jgi:hypothetical protein